MQKARGVTGEKCGIGKDMSVHLVMVFCVSNSCVFLFSWVRQMMRVDFHFVSQFRYRRKQQAKVQ